MRTARLFPVSPWEGGGVPAQGWGVYLRRGGLYAFSLAIYSQTLIKCNQTKTLPKGVNKCVVFYKLQAASARHFILIFYCVFKFGNPLVEAQYNSKEESAYITVACPSVNKPLNVPFLMSTRLNLYFSTNGIFSFSLLSGRWKLEETHRSTVWFFIQRLSAELVRKIKEESLDIWLISVP